MRHGKWKIGFSRGRESDAEHGEATVEFVALTALLVLPLIYLVFALGQLHATVLAAEQAAQAVASLHSLGAPESQIQAQKRQIESSFHLSSPLLIESHCGPCLRGSTLEVRVSATAILPGMDRFAGLAHTGIPVETKVHTVILKERP